MFNLTKYLPIILIMSFISADECVDDVTNAFSAMGGGGVGRAAGGRAVRNGLGRRGR